MKVKVNIRDYLAEQCGHEIRMDVPVDVPVRLDIDDLLDDNAIPDEDEFDFDLDEALEDLRQVAIIWTTDHVQEIRPDLSDDQSWEVLKTCRARWGSCQGIDWEAIEKTAEEMYGPKPTWHWHGRIDVTIADPDGYGQGEVINRLRDMAELLTKDMPDVHANADEGSVRLAEPAATPTVKEV
jgi:hypothetical protein